MDSAEKEYEEILEFEWPDCPECECPYGRHADRCIYSPDPAGSVEVDEGGSEVDSDGFCNTCGDQECRCTR